MPRFWLLKCEPDAYSIADLARDGRTGWDGVRNHQVRNFMRDEMRPGDLGIFYHSNATPPGAAGVVEIVRTGLADPSQFDPKSEYHDPKSDPAAPTWIMCEVGFVEAFGEVVALERLRAEPALAGMLILRRGNRLSVTPLTKGEFDAIRALGGGGRNARSGAKAERTAAGKAKAGMPQEPDRAPKSTAATDRGAARKSDAGGSSRPAASRPRKRA